MAGAVVAQTDRRWFDFLRAISKESRLDEVNFWRPLAQTSFASLGLGAPFFLRLKRPWNAIAGYGFFALATKIPIRLAWDTFGERNGDPNFEGFVGRIAEYREQSSAQTLDDRRDLTCIVLREARFLSEERWLPWSAEKEWPRNIVAYKGYDLSSPSGRRLAELLRATQPADLEPVYAPAQVASRDRRGVMLNVREGQRAFRLRVLDAYGRRCAVTGERSLPVIDAAHIQPYLGPASNHVQNGLALRADLHRLFDHGYVTVSEDHRFIVSQRLREDFENGRVYYGLHGRKLAVLPGNTKLRPSPLALQWHAEHVFR